MAAGAGSESEEESCSLLFERKPETLQSDAASLYLGRPSFAQKRMSNDLERMVRSTFRRIETKRFGGKDKGSSSLKNGTVQTDEEEYKVTENEDG
eukprot:CAMPEP_0185574142 /NCGR_PEP_ID=MMETSP0434-20130131/5689_1 /TAXON_ID=626734 ORGANISM="Favella taraikaensis, Strain Fe Narragansett Bay" /NCGR_SAMPLE_ID=MMETSP0434 /ASSEMBLY_ACC=CAM_ASM_000379 /LENGTH=94 /DNA_ID=CAMNT_0028190621 /DNA_START=274 /DNA_END=558 /DNA_ORIENTATION=+